MSDGGVSEWRNDWRCGPIVYHVMVDRFAPAADLEAKRHLYPAPKRLMSWDEQPRRGQRIEGITQSEHEMSFWGGDLASLRSRLGYIDDLGVDVLYLNPIHKAVTNHKYDALDYVAVSPEYGTDDDVRALADDLHGRGMRLMLDGVFNHVSAEHPRFVAAKTDPSGEPGRWFYLGDHLHRGYRGWHDSRNLPELNLEHPEARAHVVDGPDSAVRHWLRLGADGWRLDVAYDLGHGLLADIRGVAEQEQHDAWVVGEMWSYPGAWTGCLHGVMNFHARQLIFGIVRGQIRGGQASRMLERMVGDMGMRGALMSWLVLDNHDTGRLGSVFTGENDRLLAQALQFTLPGAPLVYYGVEAGMVGGQDPDCRGPMDWDNAVAGNAEFDRLARLVAMREQHPSLRWGSFLGLDSDRLVAFQRSGERLEETVVVVMNPERHPVAETVGVRDERVMGYTPMACALTGERVHAESGCLQVRMPPRSVRVFAPGVPDEGMYTPYKRMR